jgi:hypothetical protein
MRQQGDQLAKAVGEQARAARDMTAATASISKEIGLITRSNRQHLTSSEQVLGALNDIRQITERNARGVKATLGVTADLIERAQQLTAAVGDADAGQSGERGAPTSSARPRSNGNPRRPKKGTSPGDTAGNGGPEQPDGSGQ